jgi:hypothetical protein
MRASFDVVASDLSEQLLAKLRARDPGLQTLACDVAAVAEHCSGSFDGVVGFFMLHHLSDLDRVFAGPRRVLGSGARVAFCEPNAYHAPYYLQIALSGHLTWQGDGGVLRMRPSVVLGSMERAGFFRAKTELYGFAPPVIYNHPSGQRLDRALEPSRCSSPCARFRSSPLRCRSARRLFGPAPRKPLRPVRAP